MAFHFSSLFSLYIEALIHSGLGLGGSITTYFENYGSREKVPSDVTSDYC